MLKKILIPLDGSALAEKAIPFALDLIDPNEGELVLFRVAEYEEVLAAPSSIFDTYHMEMTSTYQTEKAKTYLEAVANRIATPGLTVTVSVETLIQSVADEILKVADAKDVDAIIMTTHGYSGIRQMLMGSIAKEILRKGKRTVIVIKSVIEQTETVQAYHAQHEPALS